MFTRSCEPHSRKVCLKTKFLLARSRRQPLSLPLAAPGGILTLFSSADVLPVRHHLRVFFTLRTLGGVRRQSKEISVCPARDLWVNYTKIGRTVNALQKNKKFKIVQRFKLKENITFLRRTKFCRVIGRKTNRERRFFSKGYCAFFSFLNKFFWKHRPNVQFFDKKIVCFSN